MRSLMIVAALASVAHAQARDRIARTLEPTGYRVRLAMDATTTLVGHVEIDGTLAGDTPSILLHAEGMELGVAIARGPRGDVPLRVSHAGSVLTLAGPLPAGAWTIAIDYTAKLDDEGKVVLPPDGAPRDVRERMEAARYTAAGVFRQTVDGKAYTFTQSEPMDARRFVPCVDEPDRKVPWQLTLEVPAADLAASNAPIAKETPLAGDRKRIEFAPTLPLPSYLLSFAVGPFEVIDAGRSKAGTPIRILELAGHTAPWAAKTAARVLDLLDAWTGVPYAYPKLDLVAVPRTGATWAAMENPGLVTFADWVVRGDDSVEAKRTWISIAAHELAHQWFGDLVTMRWWNDIWLNESFAVYVAHLITAQWDPRWMEPTDSAYEDPAETARPLADDVNYATYFRGGRGARTVAAFAELLGPAKFHAAIHAYLTEHAHGSVTTAELGAAFSHVYGQPLGALLVTELDRPHAPGVKVARACRGGAPPKLDISATKPTPVCVAYEQRGKREETCVLVEAAASIPLAACPRWVIPNANAAMSYHGVRSRADLVTTAQDWKLLTQFERWSLLSEVRLTEPGSSDAGSELGFALRLVDAPDAQRWAAETIARTARMAPPELRGKLDAWLDRRYGKRARVLQLRADSLEDAAVLAAAAAGRDPILEQAAVAAVAKLPEVPTNVLGAVVALALRAAPSLEPTVIAELDRAFFERRKALLNGLATSPAVLAHATTEPRLTAGDRLVLLAATCDPAYRKQAQEVASTLSDVAHPVLRGYNACLDARERETVLWRATLAP